MIDDIDEAIGGFGHFGDALLVDHVHATRRRAPVGASIRLIPI